MARGKGDGRKKIDYRVLDTRALFILCKKAYDRRYNQVPAKQWLKDNVDKEGVHLVAFQFPHNDFEGIRTVVLVKVNDTMVPREVILDMSMADFEKLPTLEQWKEAEDE